MSPIRSLKSAARAPKRRRFLLSIAPIAALAMGIAVVLPTTVSGAAEAPVGLGGASTFGVLGAAGITNTGATTIYGDVGSSPNPSETGFNTVTLNGADNAGGPVSQQAQNDLTTAYNQAAGATPFNSVATELGGSTLDPGVYRSGTLGINGTLTLDTHGNSAAVFIFQASSTLITGSASNMVFLNGASSCNVYWQVGSSATLGSTSHLIGTVMAQAAITANTGATIEGRLLARTASVTLDHNTITRPVCTAAAPTTTTASGGATTTTRSGTGGTATTTTIARTPSAGPGATTPGTPASPGTPGTPGTPATPGTPGTPGTPPLPETL